MNITRTFLIFLFICILDLFTCKAYAQTGTQEEVKLPQKGTFVLKGVATNIPKGDTYFELAVCDPFDNIVTQVPFRPDGTFEQAITIRGTQDIYLYLGDAVTLFSFPGDTLDLTFDFKNLPSSIRLKGKNEMRNRELRLEQELCQKSRKPFLLLNELSRNRADSVAFNAIKKYVEDYRCTIEEYVSRYGEIEHKDYLFQRCYFDALIPWADDIAALSELYNKMRLRCFLGDKQENTPLYKDISFNPFMSSSAISFMWGYLYAGFCGANAYRRNCVEESQFKNIHLAELVIPHKELCDWFCSLLYKKILKEFGYKPTDQMKEIGEYLIGNISTLEAADEVQTVMNQFFKKQRKGEVAPNLQLTDEKGKTVALADFNGKIVYLDFWFDGCGPCINEFKNLPAFHQKYKKYKDKIVHVYICVGSNDNRWKSLIKQYCLQGVNLHAVSGDERIADFNLNSYPLYVLIGADGRLIEFNTGRPSDFLRDTPNILDEALKKL